QWVKGKDGNRFDPQGIATRAELAQIFYNILTAAAPATAPAADEAAPAATEAEPAADGAAEAGAVA
ncbi:MAG: hypothetical protein LBH39_07565, partial [Clostridiales Family XIII bacterium]|nr:hypothetical protein [Clostridiales Family XIII bacterium]